MRTADWNTTSSVLERASKILAVFSPDRRSIGVSELSRRTGLPKSTVSRLVSELVELDYLERQGTRLALGLALFELGQLAATPQALRQSAIATMADLRNATGQTVHLAVLSGSEVVYIEILRGRAMPRLPSRVGGRMPAYATGVGKALLAFSSEEVIESVISAGLRPVGPKTITDPERLRRELVRIAKTGLAYEHEESAADISCAASPVLAGDAPAAAISVSGKNGLLDIRRIGPAVHTAALTLGRQLPPHANLLG
ncbi:IclR family transcriptional regulator [Arthrobacter sp. NPDC089319]|uniref:IclR family transcriptional regulator n=1 Tax=Arthrobacter sp. NPDC089319 TaxID=3155915 RepID=UPI0034433CDE